MDADKSTRPPGGRIRPPALDWSLMISGGATAMSWRGLGRTTGTLRQHEEHRLRLHEREAECVCQPPLRRHTLSASGGFGPSQTFRGPLRDSREPRTPIGSPDRPDSSTEPAPDERVQLLLLRPQWLCGRRSGCWAGARRAWSPPGRSCSSPSRWGAPGQGRSGGRTPLTRGVTATTRHPGTTRR